MLSHKRMVVVASCLSVCCLLLSCKKETGGTTSGQSENAPANANSATTLPQKSQERSNEVKPSDSVLALWVSGNQEKAMALFPGCNWSDELSKNGLFKLTEAEFRQLPEAERTTKLTECMALTTNIQAMVKNALTKAREAKSNGNVELSKQYLQSMSDLGKALGSDDRLEIFKYLGKTISDMAEKEIRK